MRTEGPSYQFCTFPCVNLQRFLYNNGTCDFACPSPFIQRQEGSYKFCADPCPLVSDYLYQNGTCSSYCEQYFIPVNKNGVNVCNFPCTNSGLKYLYWNGSCLGDCIFPYRTVTISGNKYCETPCLASEYLYQNGSCLSTCTSPMVSSTVDSYQLCKNAPASTLDEQVNKTADLMNSGGTASSAGMAALSVVSPSNPSSTTAGTIKQMLEYLRYLNISRSDKLEGIFNVSGSDAADFIPDPEVLQKVKDNIEDQPLPYMFKKYRVHSSFVINFGDKMMLLLILSTAMGGLFLLDYSGKWIRNAPIIKSAVKKLRVILQNFVLGQFYEQYGQIIFYASLDITSFSNYNGFAGFSLVVGVCCIFMGIPLIFLSFWIVKKYQEVKERPALDHEEKHKRLKIFEEKYKGIGLLFEDFNDNSFNQQAFLFYSVLRSCLFNLIVVFLYLSPMAQILMIIGMNISMLSYILFKRPLKSWVEFAQQICFEITVFVVSVCFLIMAIVERTEDKYLNVRDKCSDVVIIFNIIYTFLPLGFLGLRTIISFWEMFSFVRGHYLKSKGYSKAHSPPQIVQARSFSNDTSAANNTSDLSLTHLDQSHINLNDSSKNYHSHSGSGRVHKNYGDYFGSPPPGNHANYKDEIIDNSGSKVSRTVSTVGSHSYLPMPSNDNLLGPPSNNNNSLPSPLSSFSSNQGTFDYGVSQVSRSSSRLSKNKSPGLRQSNLNQERSQFSNPQQQGLQIPRNSFRAANNSIQGNNSLAPRFRSQRNNLDVNLVMDYEGGRGNSRMRQINSPQGPLSNAIKFKKRFRGKIKMPT